MQFLVRFFRLRARSCISYHMVEMIKKKKKPVARNLNKKIQARETQQLQVMSIEIYFKDINPPSLPSSLYLKVWIHHWTVYDLLMLLVQGATNRFDAGSERKKKQNLIENTFKFKGVLILQSEMTQVLFTISFQHACSHASVLVSSNALLLETNP